MHVVVAGDIGGAERLLVELATRPQKTDAAHQIALITPNRALAAYFASAGLTVHDRGPVRENPLAYLRRAFGPADVAWLSALLANQRIDVVHTHTFGSHVVGTRAARRMRLRQLRTEHHVMHYFDPTCSPFTRWAAARTERLVAVSEYVRMVIAQTEPSVALRTTVVRNGVDTSHWTPRPLPKRNFQVGLVCRLTAWKRVDRAVRAAALAKADLLVVGDGEERPRLERLARTESGAVRFVGHQTDPRAWIAECDAILSTADNEPLGLSVLEALSMERPVIAFAGGGIPEIVQHDVTGVLVREPTAAALAAAIERVRQDRPRLREMGVKGRRFAIEHCNLDQMCEGYKLTYQALLRAS
jgi:glycosyltransferase involved in cell wall biosynthesis